MPILKLLKSFAASICGAAILLTAAPLHGEETRGTPVVASHTILILGDSLASGYGTSPDDSYPALVQKRISEAGWNYRVINAAMNGCTTSAGRARLDSLLQRKVDVLVIALGGNDFLRGVERETTQQNLIAIIEQTRRKIPTVQCVLAAMEVPPLVSGEYAQSYNKLFDDVAEKTRCTLIPHFLTGVMGVPGMTLPDRIHPTAAGQQLLADHLWSALKSLLPR